MIINKINLTREMDKTEYYKKIGTRIVAIRVEKELRQEDLAEKMGVSRMQLYRIENGKVNPTIGTLKDICVALDIKIIELLDID